VLDQLSDKRIDDKKLRNQGITYIIDKLQGFDKENFTIISPMIDIVKIYGAYPMLITNEQLLDKIKFYHENNVLVSAGSTLTEYAIRENVFEQFVKEAASLGFDIIEIGENNIQLNIEQKKKTSTIIKSHGLKHYWKIGKKDPSRQLTTEKTIDKINEALSVHQDKIILEANLGYSVGIYDEKGNIKWSILSAITSTVSPDNIIFEAPLEVQQAALIAEFGQRVNLAEIKLENVASIESQRRGFLSKASFSISSLKKSPNGGPATKFIYFILQNKSPLEQSDLMHLTGLPRRTIQASIEDLKEQGLIYEKSNLEDIRRKVYHLAKEGWV
jgi:phosphosulfolactate synthase